MKFFKDKETCTIGGYDINVHPQPSRTSSPTIIESRAPGKPTENDGYIPPKRWEGEKVKHPKTGQCGYPDNKGNVWVPTGEGPLAHGGPHWDVVDPTGKKHENVFPSK